MTYIVHLIHGTWANWRVFGLPAKPRWFELGHKFRDQLETLSTSDVRVEDFRWGWGANMHGQRVKAAKRLAQKLRESDSEDRHILIGHSHGGNIALMAARYVRGSNNVLSLMALSTPFIIFSESNYTANISKYIYLIFAAIPGIVIALNFVPIALGDSLFNPFASIFAIMAAVCFSVISTKVRNAEFQEYDISREIPLTGKIDENVRLSIFRNIGDEASGVLHFFGPINFMLNSTIGKLSRISVFVCLISLFLITILTPFMLYQYIEYGSSAFYDYGKTEYSEFIRFIMNEKAVSLFDIYLRTLFGISVAITLLGAAFVALVSLLIFLLRIPFGWDLIFKEFRYAITVETTPPGEWSIVMPPAKHHVGSLAHSQSYENEFIVSTILARIKEEVALHSGQNTTK
jgi:pimeloyl-ACP methyl ester carboxylesterase